MMPLVDWAASYLPESIAQHLDFEPDMPEQSDDEDPPEEPPPTPPDEPLAGQTSTQRAAGSTRTARASA